MPFKNPNFVAIKAAIDPTKFCFSQNFKVFEVTSKSFWGYHKRHRVLKSLIPCPIVFG